MIRAALTITLALLATTAHADLPWSVSARRVHAVAVDGERAYLATGDNHAELVVADVMTGATLGTFDADGRADAISVRVLEPGVVKLGRRRSSAPEVYRLDVSDPAAIEVLSTGERARSVHWEPATLPPVRFRDANGDGVFRLACLGDSNTVQIPIAEKWCERLAKLVADPRFEVVNLGWGGATVCPNLAFASTGEKQLAAALELQVDAVVMAFGTNDRLQGRTPAEIVEAYSALADAAGVEVFVATTPPMGGCSGAGCGRIVEANALLEARFPGRTVDFFSGFTDEHFRLPDRIHMNEAGQALRAERALAVIGSPMRER